MTHTLDPDNRLIIDAESPADGFDLADLAGRLTAAGADVQVERESGIRLVVALRLRPGPRPGKPAKVNQSRVASLLGSEVDAEPGGTHKGIGALEPTPRQPVSPPAHGSGPVKEDIQ